MGYHKTGRMLLSGAFMAVSASSVMALPESCSEFSKIVAPRIALIEKLASFKSKKPTAAEACKVMTNLTATDKKILEWMITNKEWCQVPEDQITQLQQSSEQSGGFKAKACAAAVTQAKQIEQMKRAQAQGAGQSAPGSGVRLPQGAL